MPKIFAPMGVIVSLLLTPLSLQSVNIISAGYFTDIEANDTIPVAQDNDNFPPETTNYLAQPDTVNLESSPIPGHTERRLQNDTLTSNATPKAITGIMPETGTQIPPFDPDKSFDVPLDSLILKGGSYPQVPVFAAREFYGTTNLLHPVNYLPKPLAPSPKVPGILTFILLFAAVNVGVANLLFPLKLREMVRGAWDAGFFAHMDRGKGILKHYVTFFLYLNFVMVIVVLTFQTLNYFGYNLHIKHIQPLLFSAIIAVFLMIYSVIKYYFVTFISWVFLSQDSARTYMRNVLVVNSFSGLLLLPGLIIYTFNPISAVLYVLIGLFILVGCYKALRGAILGHMKTGLPVYYLILYICTVEIAPKVVLLKVSIEYFSG